MTRRRLSGNPQNDEPDPAGSRRAFGMVSLAVFLASSTWFSGTAAVPALTRLWNLSEVRASWLTIAVQLGFIAGTFLYALLNVADLFPARRVFAVSAAAGAAFNAAFALASGGLGTALLFRLLTGLSLAGVYPVGMKIIAQWFRRDLGWRLGVMVGALTLGTAAPYLVYALGADLEWRISSLAATGLALLGGGLIAWGVEDGPYLREPARFDVRAGLRVFGIRPFRLQALGYFGHMWELYAFWSLDGPFLAASLRHTAPGLLGRVPLASFLIIGIGAAGCAAGGWISKSVGERNVAVAALAVSAACAASSGLFFVLPPAVLLPFVLVWGIAVVADSPQFSAIAARSAPPAYTGTALTVQNGIGFLVTVVSIQAVSALAQQSGWRWALTSLAAGPILGLLAMLRLKAFD